MTEKIIKASQELDEALNQLERGEISKDELEYWRQELHKELQAWYDSNADRLWW